MFVINTWWVPVPEDSPEDPSGHDPSTRALQQSQPQEYDEDNVPAVQSQRQSTQRPVANLHVDHSNNMGQSQRQITQRQQHEDHGSKLREWPARLTQKQQREPSQDEDDSTDEERRARNVSVSTIRIATLY